MANLTQTKRLIPLCEKTGVTLFLWGDSGVGKTEGIEQYCKENDTILHTIRAGQMEAGDFLGMPTITNNVTVYCRPNWLPEEDGKKHVFFMDEINRARIDVIQALFQFVEQKKIHQYTAPKNSIIVCAGNPGSEYDVSELDPAFMKRCLHIKVTPTAEEWINWMSQNYPVKPVINTIRQYQNLLDSPAADISWNLTQSRRGWTNVAKFIQANPETDLIFEITSGLIGHEAALTFMQTLNAKEKPIPAKDVLKDFERVKEIVEKYSNPESSRSDLLNITTEDLINLSKFKKSEGLNKSEKQNLVEFLMTIPADLTANFVNKAFKYEWFRKLVLVNSERFKERQSKMYNELKQG